MCFLVVLLLTISLQLVVSHSMCLPSFLVFTPLLHRNHVKKISRNSKDLTRVGLAVLKKIVSKKSYYKQGKLVSYFLSNAASAEPRVYLGILFTRVTANLDYLLMLAYSKDL